MFTTCYELSKRFAVIVNAFATLTLFCTEVGWKLAKQISSTGTCFFVGLGHHSIEVYCLVLGTNTKPRSKATYGVIGVLSRTVRYLRGESQL